MRDEFLVERSGKRFVLYAGLLDAAHEQGLKSIETELLEKPNQMNGSVAIVKARVTMEDGRVFEGIGDASPDNVGRNIAPHAIRMSETRAKARALRDAINIGVTALEELGGEVDAPASSRTSARSQDSKVTPMRQQQRKASSASRSRGAEDRENMPATRKQLNYLETLLVDMVDGGLPAFEEKIGKKFTELTRSEASEWIGRFSGKAAP